MRVAAGLSVLVLTAGLARDVSAQNPPDPAARAGTVVESYYRDQGFWVDGAVARYAMRSEIIDGSATLPFVGFGYQVSRRFSIRVETTIGGSDFDRTRHARFVLRPGNDRISEALRQMSREEIERLWPETDLHVARRVRFVTSVLAGTHGQVSSRVRLSLLGGLTFQGERTSEFRTDPTLLDLTPTYAFHTETTTTTRTQGLLAGGLDVEIRVTPHLAVVPQLRIDFGKDVNDPDDWFVITRPGVAIRWAF
jgi:hypothetical protein